MPKPRIDFFNTQTQKQDHYLRGGKKHRQLVKSGLVLPPEGKKLNKPGTAFIVKTARDKEREKRQEHQRGYRQLRATADYKAMHKQAKNRAKQIRKEAKNFSTVQIRARVFVRGKAADTANPDAVAIDTSNKPWIKGPAWLLKSHNIPIVLPTAKIGKVMKTLSAGAVGSFMFPSVDDFMQQFIRPVDHFNDATNVRSLAGRIWEFIESDSNFDWPDLLIVFDNFQYSNDLTDLPEMEAGDIPLARDTVNRHIAGRHSVYTISSADTWGAMFPDETNLQTPHYNLEQLQSYGLAGAKPLQFKSVKDLREALMSAEPVVVPRRLNSCLINWFIGTYGEAKQKYGHKNKGLLNLAGPNPYSVVWDFLFPGQAIPDLGMEVTLNQMRPLFQLYKLNVTALSWPPELKVVFEANYADGNANIHPHSPKLLIKNGHAYELKQYHRVMQPGSINKEVTLTTSGRFWLPRKVTVYSPDVQQDLKEEDAPILEEKDPEDEEATQDAKKKKKPPKKAVMYPFTLIDHPDDIARHIWSAIGVKCNTFRFYARSEETTLEYFLELLLEQGYEPEILARDGDRVGGLYINNLQRQGVDEQTIDICIEMEPLKFNKALVQDDAQLRLFKELMQKQQRKLMSDITMSRYHPEFMDLLNTFKTGGARGYLCNVDRYIDIKQMIGFDVCKAYPNAIMQLDAIPVFNMFDRPVRLTTRPVELDDYSFYVVRFHDNNNYAMRDYHMALGKTLKMVQPRCDFLWEIRPSRVQEYDFAEFWQDIFQCEDLPIEARKTVAVITLGMLGKSTNRRFRSQIFLLRDEALRCRSELPEQTTSMIQLDDGRYLVTNTATATMYEGFLPVYQAMIDMHFAQMWMLGQTLERHGMQPLYVATDCVYVEYKREMGDVKAIQESLPDLMWRDTDKTEFENIGGMKLEHKYRNTRVSMARSKPEYHSVFHSLQDQYKAINMTDAKAPLMYVPTDEFNDEEVFTFMDQHKDIMVMAETPGCGKSYTTFAYCRSRNLKAVVLAAYNKTVLESAWDDEHKFTAASFFQMGKRGEDLVTGVPAAVRMRVGEYDTVVVEEIGNWGPDLLTQLQRLRQDFPHVRFIVNGDVQQLPPICMPPLNHVRDSDSYYTNILDEMFPVQVFLKEPKRCRCEKHRVDYTMEEIRDCDACVGERQRWLTICRAITNAPTVQDAVRAVKKYFRKGKPHATKINIAYTNRGVDGVNAVWHRKVCAAKGINPSTHPYYVGQVLLCRKRYDGKFGQLYVNCEYVVSAVNKNTLLLDNRLGAQEIPTFIVRDKCKDSFCQTGHSLQGGNISEPYTVHEIDHQRVCRKWLFVAFTRNVNLDQVFWSAGDDTTIKFPTLQEIQFRINSHVQQDIKAGRLKDGKIPRNYITPEFIMKLMRNTHTCAVCHNDMDYSTWSINRISGDHQLAHVRGNINILCSKDCNSSLK